MRTIDRISKKIIDVESVVETENGCGQTACGKNDIGRRNVDKKKNIEGEGIC